MLPRWENRNERILLQIYIWFSNGPSLSGWILDNLDQLSVFSLLPAGAENSYRSDLVGASFLVWLYRDADRFPISGRWRRHALARDKLVSDRLGPKSSSHN